uniref:Uncharacterized protein n=1 Tax=Anguilla anguilla TaxID=7936 RepID=A0A0E9UPH1_ANGAN
MKYFARFSLSGDRDPLIFCAANARQLDYLGKIKPI